MTDASEIQRKSRAGLQTCSLNELLFHVEMLDNPNPANTEYQKVVRGFGDFTITVPEYVKEKRKIERGVDKGKIREITTISYPTQDVGEIDLNYCSHRYELVPNADIFPKVRQILTDNNIKFSEKYMHMDYARFYAEYRIETHAFQVGGNKEDVVYPMLKVQHSYNGLTEYQITFGYYRLVCSNGLVIPVEEKSRFNIRLVGKHTKAIQTSLHRLTEVLEFFVKQKRKPLINFDKLADRWVEKWEDRVVEVLNASKINIIDNAKFRTMDHIRGRIEKETAQLQTGGKVNEWLIYNAINHYLFNNERNSAASPKQREDKDRAVMKVLLVEAGLS